MSFHYPRVLANRNIEKPDVAISLHGMRLRYDDSPSETILDKYLLFHFPRSVLLGEQGAGKSSILKNLKQLNPEECQYFDLETTQRLSHIDNKYNAIKHPESIYFLFDSLERFEMIDDLIDWIASHSHIWKGFLIASRSWAWKEQFNAQLHLSQVTLPAAYHLKDRQKETQVLSIWTCDFLPDEFYISILGDRYSDFMDEASGSRDLLRTAVDGFAITQLYKKGQALPQSRYELLCKRTEVLLKEISPQTTTLQTELIRADLRDLALIQTFAHSEEKNITEINLRNFLSRDATKQDQNDLLQSEMIKVGTDQSVSFFHSVYREFLVSQAIANFPLFHLKQLLFIEGRVVPKEYKNILGYCLTHQSLQGKTQLAEFLLAYQDDSSALILLDESKRLQALLKRDYVPDILDYLIQNDFYPHSNLSEQTTFSDVLKNHQPENPVQLIEKYLHSELDIPVIWGCHAIQAWNLNSHFNQSLLEIALNRKKPDKIRKACFKLVDLSLVKEGMPLFQKLLKDDFFEAHDVIVKIIQFKLKPNEFFPIVFKFISNYNRQALNRISFLKLGRDYAYQLNKHDLSVALDCLKAETKTGKFGSYGLLNGFIHQAKELNIDIPPEIISLALDDAGDISIIGYLKHNGIIKNWGRLVDHLNKHPANTNQEILLNWLQETGRELLPELKQIYPDLNILILNKSFKLEDLLLSWLKHKHYKSSFKPQAQELVFYIQKYYPDFECAIPDPFPPFNETQIEIFLKGTDPAHWRIFTFFNDANLPKDMVRQGCEKLEKTEKIISKELWRNLISEFIQNLKSVNSIEKTIDRRDREIYLEAYITACYFLIKNPSLIPDGIEPLTVQDKLNVIQKFLYSTTTPTVRLPKDYLQYLYTLNYKDLCKLTEKFVIAPMNPHPANANHRLRWLETLLELFSQNQDRFFVKSIEQQLYQFQFYNISDLRNYLNYLKKLDVDNYKNIINFYQTQLPEYYTNYKYNPQINPYWDSFNPNLIQHFLERELMLLGLEMDLEWAWEKLNNCYISHTQSPFTLELNETVSFPEKEDHRPIFNSWLSQLLKAKDPLYEKRRNANDFSLNDLRDTSEILFSAIQQKLTPYQTYKYLYDLQQVESDLVIRSEIRFFLDRCNIEGRKFTKRELFSLHDKTISHTILDIESDSELFELTKDLLQELQLKFDQGKGTLAFWRYHNDVEIIPRVEDECQNILGLLLELAAEKWGYHINFSREKPVSKNRQDFCFSVDKVNDKFTLPIELKVTHKDKKKTWLIDPIQNQLYEKYMKPQGCQFGIFIVLWFKCDEFKYPTVWQDKDSYVKALNAKAAEVSKLNKVQIFPCVLDLTADRPPLKQKEKTKV